MSNRGALSLVVCVLAGILQALSMANPWTGEPLWWMQLIAMGVLAWHLEHSQNWRTAAWRTWCFSAAWLGATFWWLYISLHTYGGLPAWLAVLAVAALASALALLYAAAMGLYVQLKLPSASHRAVLFAALWLLAEMARGRWLTGFGWGAAGYAHVTGPLAVFAPWVGLYGLCALSVWWSAALIQASKRDNGQRLAVLIGGLLVALLHLWAPDFSTANGSMEVALLQGNIAQEEKFLPGSGVPKALAWYEAQLLQSTSALVVAPETAIPLLPQQLPQGYLQGLQQHFAQGQQAALIGIPLGDFKTGYTNSMIGLKPKEAEVWRYDKHHLVLFGEVIPPLFKWFVDLMNIPLGDFNRGDLRQPAFEWQGQRLAANICYEDLFGEELGARFEDRATAPTIFVNSSNLGWFGDSVAIDQHLNISRMRALEFELPMIRATNTGATAVIDHQGRVQAQLPRLTQGVLVADVQGRSSITPYAWWVSRLSLWPLWLLCLGLVAWAWRQRPRTWFV